MKVSAFGLLMILIAIAQLYGGGHWLTATILLFLLLDVIK